jgi:large subunit ribosomal protein L15
MQIHNLKRKTENKKTPIVGRGGKRGKTSGRGGKGQTARAGHKVRPEMRDLIKRIPKLRGYAFNSYAEKAFPVNLSAIEFIFSNNDSVTPATLVEKGIAERRNGKLPNIKILSMGDLTKKINVSGCSVSALAKEKIEKAGGSVK